MSLEDPNALISLPSSDLGRICADGISQEDLKNLPKQSFPKVKLPHCLGGDGCELRRQAVEAACTGAGCECSIALVQRAMRQQGVERFACRAALRAQALKPPVLVEGALVR